MTTRPRPSGSSLTPAEFDARSRVLQRAFHDLATAPQVTIAAVNGYALGGGCELALRYAKQAVDAALKLRVSAGLALEADLIATCFASEDGQHGLRGFVENGPRKATFHGR